MIVRPVAATATKGSRTDAVGKRVRDFLDKHPDLASSPQEIVAVLGVNIGSAKRDAKAWRDSRKLDRFGPVLLQNLRFFGRTTPGTTWPGSPPPGWRVRGRGEGGDHKLTRTVALPPDGHMDVCCAPNGGAEITMAAPRALT